MRSGQLLFTGILCLVATEAAHRGFAVTPVIAGVLLILGIGHGLFDALLAARIWHLSLRVATARYALAALGAGFVSFAFPALALVLHTLVSAYHFAQAEWGEPLERKLSQRVVRLFWGLAIVGAMVLGPWAEAGPVLATLLRHTHPNVVPFLQETRHILLSALATTGLASAAWLERRERSNEGGVPARLLEMLLLYALFLRLPLWISFSLYLSLWHGLRSVSEDIVPQLQEVWKETSSKVPLALAVAAAVFGTAFAVYFGMHWNGAALHEHWFVGPTAFALLIAVTFPHAVVMAYVAAQKKNR